MIRSGQSAELGADIAEHLRQAHQLPDRVRMRKTRFVSADGLEVQRETQYPRSRSYTFRSALPST